MNNHSLIHQNCKSVNSQSKILALCFFVFAFLISDFSTYGQVPTIYLLSADSSFKERDGLIQLSGQAAIGSNVLDNLFLKKSFLGGKIEDLHLDRIADETKEQNRAGFMLGASLEFMNLRDTILNHPKWGFRVGISSNYHAGINFSRDLFKTIYRGNEAFRNDSAMLGPLTFQYQAWQKFGFGIFNKSNFSSVSLSLVEGQAYKSLVVSQAGLYTSATGDSLALTYRGDYLRSDTSRTGWANGSGLGVALDFEYNLPMNDHRGMISLSVHDIGFIAWGKSSSRITFDSLSTWRGVNVQDVFQLSDDSIKTPDLRDSLHYQVKQKSFFAPLPASVHLRYSRFFNATDCYEIGMSMWPNSSAIPFIYGGINHFVGTHFIMSERISFGGYSRFGIGAEAQWMPCSAWLLRLGTNHLEGFTMNSAHGRDIYFTLAKTF